jgi:hypothetical protein
MRSIVFGILREQDAITMNRERVMSDGKAVALELARQGYRPRRPRRECRGRHAARHTSAE